MMLFMLLLLGACAAPEAPRATLAPAPTVPAVGELLASPEVGPVKALGYLYITGDGAVLVDGLSFGASGEPAPLGDGGLWLGPAAGLLADDALTGAGPVRYAIVAASGTLEGPGAYGPEAYAYQLAAPSVEALSVRDLTIPLLLNNAGLYEGQPVRLQGELLTDGESALLVERLGAGGVPADSELQLKLAAPPRDEALTGRLRSAGDGAVRFGPVELTGLWRSGRLYPLSIIPR
jgi:hypothetical protein